jgi:hypothetical protein
MERSNEILIELEESAPYLSKYGKSRIPYSLPPGYFENLPERIMNRIRLQTSAKESQEISARLEIADISPLLAGLQDKNPYEAPLGYFEKLNINPAVFESGTRSASFEGAQETPVIPNGLEMISKKALPFQKSGKTPIFNFSGVVKYAVAACFVALVGLSLFNLIYHRNKGTDPINGLMTVSDQDMANYLDADDVHWTPGVRNSSETASIELSDNDIHELFSNVSDDELEQYIPPFPLEKGTVN